MQLSYHWFIKTGDDFYKIFKLFKKMKFLKVPIHLSPIYCTQGADNNGVDSTYH